MTASETANNKLLGLADAADAAAAVKARCFCQFPGFVVSMLTDVQRELIGNAVVTDCARRSAGNEVSYLIKNSHS